MWLIIGALCLTGTLVGIVLGIQGNSVAWPVAAACAVGLLLSLWQSRRSRQDKVDQIRQRFDFLVEQARAPDFSLEVYGGSGLVLSIPMLAMSLSILIFNFSSAGVLAAIAGYAMLFVSLILLANSLSVIGQPVLKLTHAGIQSPHSPLIPWAAITHVQLMRHRFHGIEMGGALNLTVPDLANSHGLFHWFARVTRALRFGEKKNVFPVMLQQTSEPFDLIYEMTCVLWRHNAR